MGSSTPPTTCAFVITRRSANTKPVPSRTFPQLCAVPTTFTMERWARPATGLPASAGSGGWTLVMGSLANGLKTCGKPFCASTEEKSANHVSACAGSARETPSSTLELRTSLPTVGSVVPARAEPISQATSSMATTLTRAPPLASRARAGDHVMYRRSLLPRWVVSACPTEAQTITTTTATTAAVVLTSALSVSRSQITGSA
ncbi:hypothetical protein SGLAM104S_06264 [Streptomyces glaucescens]